MEKYSFEKDIVISYREGCCIHPVYPEGKETLPEKISMEGLALLSEKYPQFSFHVRGRMDNWGFNDHFVEGEWRQENFPDSNNEEEDTWYTTRISLTDKERKEAEEEIADIKLGEKIWVDGVLKDSLREAYGRGFKVKR